MEDQVCVQTGGRRLRHIPRVPRQSESVRELLGERGAELAARAGDQDAAAASRLDRIGDCVLQR